MTTVIDLHRRALEQLTREVHTIESHQWAAPTPCRDWDVRALVNHLLVEQLWVPELLAGQTIADVGDRFDGDQLGTDPAAAWDRAAADALVAFASPWAQQQSVHLSYGDSPMLSYCSEMTVDAVVHRWDLAKAIDGGESMDPELVAFALRTIEPQLDALAASGLFDPAVPVSVDADDQTRLLGLLGRAR